LTKGFPKVNIAVVGDLILDHYIWGLVERISPEAPVPVVDVKREDFNLGGAANVASNVVALGAKVTVVGIRGDDLHGEVLERLLSERKINTDGLFIGSRPTTVKTRVIAHNQQVVRFDREERRRISKKRFSLIREFLVDNRDKFDAIIISDYKKGIVTESLMRFVVNEFKDTFIAVDPKVGHFNLYKRVSIITPNLKEASQGAGVEIEDENSLKKAGIKLKRRLNCDAVLITRGEQGMSLFEDKRITHIPTVAKSVYDVTGAGDTVIATLTVSHVAGATLREAAIVSNHAASVVVSKLGTATATVREIAGSLRQNSLEIREERLL
ncbi:MAG: D-glycero-beta-D-manno-heptose-7-phosphate kinase, partial [Nitrospirae bacterium]